MRTGKFGSHGNVRLVDLKHLGVGGISFIAIREKRKSCKDRVKTQTVSREMTKKKRRRWVCIGAQRNDQWQVVGS